MVTDQIVSIAFKHNIVDTCSTKIVRTNKFGRTFIIFKGAGIDGIAKGVKAIFGAGCSNGSIQLEGLNSDVRLYICLFHKL